MSPLTGDDPDWEAVTRLLDLAVQRGFTFTAHAEGSLWGEREDPQWHDVVFLGSSGHGNACRSRRGHLAPGESLFAQRITGTALSVLHTVVYGWPPL